VERPLDHEDAAAIANVAALYGHIFDAREWSRLSEVFVEDGVFEFTRLNARLEGIDQIRDFVSSRTHPPAHHTTNLYIYESEGQVRSQSKFFIPDNGEFKGGDYHDTWVRSGAGWRIKERVAIPRWTPETPRS
jgi:hypothetical protein